MVKLASSLSRYSTAWAPSSRQRSAVASPMLLAPPGKGPSQRIYMSTSFGCVRRSKSL